MINVHVTNISRYERGENKTTAQVLSRLVNTLEVSAHFLIASTTADMVQVAITNRELLEQFKKVDQLPEDKNTSSKNFSMLFSSKLIYKRNLLPKISPHKKH